MDESESVYRDRLEHAISFMSPGDRVMCYFQSGNRWAGVFDGVVWHKEHGRSLLLLDTRAVFMGMCSAEAERAVAPVSELNMVEYLG